MRPVPSARKEPSPESDFPLICLQVLDYAKRYINIGRAQHAWVLIEILRCALAFETLGSRPS